MFRPAKIAAMGELRFSDTAAIDDEGFREEWGRFYAVRRRLLIRLLWMAAGLGICMLVLFTKQADKYSHFEQVLLTLPLGLLLIALPIQWIKFVWELLTWPCPRCAKSFFTSGFGNNPFVRRCRHCGLLRLKPSELKSV